VFLFFFILTLALLLLDSWAPLVAYVLLKFNMWSINSSRGRWMITAE